MKMAAIKRLALALCTGILTTILTACQMSINDGSGDTNAQAGNKTPTENNTPSGDTQESIVSDFSYELYEGGIRIRGYNGFSLKVRIPDLIEGLPVPLLVTRLFQVSVLRKSIFQTA